MQQDRLTVASTGAVLRRWLALAAAMLALSACSPNSPADETDATDAVDAATTAAEDGDPIARGTAPTTTATPAATEPDDAATGPGASAEPDVASPAPTPIEVARLAGVTTVSAFDGTQGLPRWQSDVPRISDVRIQSSADDSQQPALWLPPPGEERPLLVVLHSWSTGYLQHLNIPYGQWATENGWGMIAPNFRGVNETAQATGSPLAVADVIDAVDYALAEGGGDPDRVFVVGFSGGGMMSLLMAGHHPDRFAGVVSWVPIHDLREWYRFNAEQDPQPAYVAQIEASCGGPPVDDSPAAQECLSRSPVAHLDAARAADLPVYIGVGLSDDTVPASNAVESFNQLADPEDRFTADQIDAIGAQTLPEELTGQLDAESFFAAAEPAVLLTRRSGPVTLAVFDGSHDMVYNPGLLWMARGAPSEG